MFTEHGYARALDAQKDMKSAVVTHVSEGAGVQGAFYSFSRDQAFAVDWQNRGNMQVKGVHVFL